MTYNRITAEIGESRRITTRPVSYQYDTVQILMLTAAEGVELPEFYQVDFCVIGDEDTVTMVGSLTGGAPIPDGLLRQGENLMAFLVLTGTESDVQTRYEITIPVNERPTRSGIELSDDQQAQVDSLIAALNEGVDRAEDAADAIENMGAEAETLPEGSEASVTKTVDPETGVVTLTFGIPKGAHGDPGYSPTIEIATITGGHRITVTDSQGSASFDVMDGEQGDPGAPGDDGYSPAVTITQITNGHRVTITDKTHQSGQTFDVMDGEQGDPGTPGDDGYSPAVTITTITGGHRVTITDKTHPSGQSFDVMDGASDAGQVSYDPTQTYQSGTVGKELSDQSNAIGELADNGAKRVLNWENGSWSGSSTASPYLTDVNTRVRPSAFIPVKVGDVVTISNGTSYQHAVGIWAGVQGSATKLRSDGTWTATDESIGITYNGFMIVAFADSTDTSTVLDPADFDGGISITSYAGKINLVLDSMIETSPNHLWRSGLIQASSGNYATDASYIMTEILYGASTGVIKVTANSGYRFCFAVYDLNGTYLGYFKKDMTYAKTNGDNYSGTEFYFIDYPQYLFRAIAYRSPISSGIDPSEGENILFHRQEKYALKNNGAAGVALGTGMDCNDLTEGTYFCVSATVAAQITNSPYTASGYLLYVIKLTNAERYTQIAIENSAVRHGMRMRTNTGSGYSEWSDFSFADNSSSYVISESNRVADNVRSIQNGKTVTTIGISDTHYRSGDETVMNAIKDMSDGVSEIRRQLFTDFDVCYGDIGYVYTGYTGFSQNKQSMIEETKLVSDCFSSERQIRLVGNHDMNAMQSPYYFTEDNVYGFSGIYNMILNKPETNRNRSYGYMDDEYRKLRFICLNTSDFADQPSGKPNQGDSGNLNYFMSADQIAWFVDKLDMTGKSDAEDWQIILMSHMSLDQHTLVNDGYSELLYAYENGGSGTLKGVAYDFAGKNTAKLALYIHGHTHSYIVDNHHHKSGSAYPRIKLPRICVPNALPGREVGADEADSNGIVWGNGDAAYVKTAGTAESTSFVVNTIDPDAKVIYSHHYGAGIDRILHYDPITVSSTHTITGNKLTPASWTSMDTSIATVSSGVVTAVASGNVLVYLKDSNGNREYWNIHVD